MRVVLLMISLMLLTQDLMAEYRSINDKQSLFMSIFNTANPGGYEDYALGEDEYIISYQASDSDSSWQENIGFFEEKNLGKKRTYAYALKRAGEVAWQKGYPYFVILEENSGNHISRTDYSTGFSVNTYTVVLRIRLLKEVGQEEAYESSTIANWNFKS
jgi:hypothetical protein